MILYLLISFVFGAALGSFLGVLVDRLSRGEQVLRGRSKCEHCKRELKALDLIPIASFLALGGKCRYCHAPIPGHVLVSELAGGIIASTLLLFSFYSNLTTMQYILLLVIFFSLAGIFLADFSHGVIPDEFNILILIASLLLLILVPEFNLKVLIGNIFIGILSFSFFMAIFLATKGRGMGFGDVKFSFVMGLFLGFPNIIVGLYFAFLTGMVVSLILVMKGKKKLKGDTISFGPFLVAGSVFAFFFGQKIFELIF